MPRVSLYGAVLLAASAYGAAGGSLRAAVAPLTLWAAIGLTRHYAAVRRARKRSWQTEPVMVRPWDWRRDGDA